MRIKYKKYGLDIFVVGLMHNCQHIRYSLLSKKVAYFVMVQITNLIIWKTKRIYITFKTSH